MSGNGDTAVHALLALAAGEIEELERLYAPDFVFHTQAPGQVGGHAGLRHRALLLNSSLYDPTLTIEFVIEHGEHVVVRWRGRAVHKGDLLGVPGSGNSVETAGITIFRLEAGRVVEEWTEFDGLGMARQIMHCESPAGGLASA